MIGEEFTSIEKDLSSDIANLNYIDVAKNGLLTFNQNGELIAAYPVSPRKTNYKVDIEDIGSGYAMCAIDALGIAYTFMKKTSILTTDFKTGENIEFTIDPFVEIEHRKIYVTYINSTDLNCDPAVDQCPSLNFYTSLDHIDNKEKYIILEFNEAVKHSISVFGEKGIKRCIRGALVSSNKFALSDILIDVFEK